MHRYQDDLQLMELIAIGNEEAFEKLFNRYWERLFAAAMKRLRSKELAQDVIQELFIDLWENRKTLEIRSNVRGYLYTALKHRIINRIKSEDIREKYEKMTIHFYEVNDLATEHQFSRNNLRDKMEQRVEKLPDRCQQVFELSRIEELTHKEIAKKLNISPKTVENHIGRALKKLRPYLREVISIVLTFPLIF